MLSIPKEIKELFREDGIKKYAKITFPYDDIPDILNDQIESESINLKENLNSESEFKFGLCEKTTLSFSCRDVDNIKGKTIKLYLGVDTESIKIKEFDNPYYIPLGEFIVDKCTKEITRGKKRNVTAYSRDVNNDEKVSEYMSDVWPSYTWYTNSENDEFKMYSKFTDHDMKNLIFPGDNLDKMKDLDDYYTSKPIEGFISVDEFEEKKGSTGNIYDRIKKCHKFIIYGKILSIPSITNFSRDRSAMIISNIKTTKSDEWENDFQLLKQKFIDITGDETVYSLNFSGYDGVEEKTSFYGDYSSYYGFQSLAIEQGIANEYDFYEISELFNYKHLCSGNIGYLKRYSRQPDGPYQGPLSNYWYSYYDQESQTNKYELHKYDRDYVYNYQIDNSSIYSIAVFRDFDEYEHDDYAYTIYSEKLDSIYIPTKAFILDENNNVIYSTKDYSNDNKLYIYSEGCGRTGNVLFSLNSDSQIDVNVQSWQSVYHDDRRRIEGVRQGDYQFKWPDGLKNYDKFVKDYCEILGCYGNSDRNGKFTEKYLNPVIDYKFPSQDIFPSQEEYPTEAPEFIQLRDYSSALIDDEYVKPYGRILCTYMNVNGVIDTYIHYIVDKKVYNKTKYIDYKIYDNNLLHSAPHTKEYIENLCANIASRLEFLKYINYDIEIEGLPYLEVGDAILIDDGENTYSSYIFKRELKGIQSLTDSITCDFN